MKRDVEMKNNQQCNNVFMKISITIFLLKIENRKRKKLLNNVEKIK